MPAKVVPMAIPKRNVFIEKNTSMLCAEIVQRVGVDNITVSDFCVAAGISRPTFYGRFGNVDGLLADTWLDAGSEWLNRLLEPEYAPRIEDFGLLEILVASRRRPEIIEIVEPSVSQWWQGMSQNHSAGVVSWILANRLGTMLTQRTDGMVNAASRLELLLLPLIHGESFESQDWRSPGFTLNTVEIADPIVNAAMTVISRSGFHGATMSRIARATSVSTGALYPRFSSATELAELCFSSAQAEIVAANDALWNKHKFSIAGFGQFVGAGLEANRDRWRRLRVETFLVSHRNASLDAVARDSVRLMVTNLTPTMISVGVPDQFLSTIGYMFHTLGVGFSILFEAGINVPGYNHTAIAEATARALRPPNP